MSKKSVEMAPVLQSMQEYIDNHFSDELLDELSEGIKLGLVQGLDITPNDGTIVIARNECRLVRSDFWQLDRTHLLADLRMRVRMGIANEDRIPHFKTRYINFSAQFTLDHGISLHPGIREMTTECLPERDLPKLTKYLVPVLNNNEMEIRVNDLLRNYLGDTATKVYQQNGAHRLAAAMGLNIIQASLYQNHHTASVLYLRETEVEVVASGNSGDGTDCEDSDTLIVPERTILLNDNKLHCGDLDRDIYHECGHYEWHSMFFELQSLHAADLRLLEYQEADKASKPALKDIRWIERQANFVGIAAMFPRNVMVPLTKKYWHEVIDTDYNQGKKIAHVICEIASEKQKSKSLIKTRMITMGSVAAKGACNYVDGHYIEPFAFDCENLDVGDTFVISRGQFIEMYEEDESFRALISTQRFVYADGHVCYHHPSFVRPGSKGPELTKWALAHVDECCLKFEKSYHYSPCSHYQLGELHSDQDYNEAYLMIHSMSIAGISKEELMERNLDYLDELPKSWAFPRHTPTAL